VVWGGAIDYGRMLAGGVVAVEKMLEQCHCCPSEKVTNLCLMGLAVLVEQETQQKTKTTEYVLCLCFHWASRLESE